MSIKDALYKNLEIVEKEKGSLTKTELQEVKDIEDDYKYSREALKKLVDTSSEALEPLLQLALDSESPRAFEVLSNMLKQTSEMTEKIMDLQQKKKNINKSEGDKDKKSSNGEYTQNNIFLGSTTELQKHLKEINGKDS